MHEIWKAGWNRVTLACNFKHQLGTATNRIRHDDEFVSRHMPKGNWCRDRFFFRSSKRKNVSNALITTHWFVAHCVRCVAAEREWVREGIILDICLPLPHQLFVFFHSSLHYNTTLCVLSLKFHFMKKKQRFFLLTSLFRLCVCMLIWLLVLTYAYPQWVSEKRARMSVHTHFIFSHKNVFEFRAYGCKNVGNRMMMMGWFKATAIERLKILFSTGNQKSKCQKNTNIFV